jgi:hypothetical protein
MQLMLMKGIDQSETFVTSDSAGLRVQFAHCTSSKSCAACKATAGELCMGVLACACGHCVVAVAALFTT